MQKKRNYINICSTINNVFLKNETTIKSLFTRSVKRNLNVTRHGNYEETQTTSHIYVHFYTPPIHLLVHTSQLCTTLRHLCVHVDPRWLGEVAGSVQLIDDLGAFPGSRRAVTQHVVEMFPHHRVTQRSHTRSLECL